MCLSLCAHLYICVSVCMPASLCVQLYICASVCPSVRICTCACLPMSVRDVCLCVRCFLKVWLCAPLRTTQLSTVFFFLLLGWGWGVIVFVCCLMHSNIDKPI